LGTASFFAEWIKWRGVAGILADGRFPTLHGVVLGIFLGAPGMARSAVTGAI
jgi:hypothetical protein